MAHRGMLSKVAWAWSWGLGNTSKKGRGDVQWGGLAQVMESAERHWDFIWY